MSYLVLARKYRPRTFAEVVGQEVTTAVLRGAIADGRVGHAYLLCGPRGTGKTTTARILAKALNCERGPAPDPCGECERCVGADRGAEVDLVEIDAASHTGVDNIRELRDQAAYAPMRARHKVYLIDEVHMLSKGAFNALLKTLEEPPPRVVFLFATTEPHKVPDTILSRCQVLRLAPIREEHIAARLAQVFEREGVRAGAGVVEEVARRARGGMRDALSLADQLLALVGDEPVLDDLQRIGGEAGERELEVVFERIEAGDRAGCLAALPADEGGEAGLLDGLLAHLRGCLLASLCGVDNPFVQGSAELRQRLAERGRRLGPERLRVWLAELLHARERLTRLPGQERLVVELALLELCRADAGVSLVELEDRLIALEARLASGPVAASAPVASAPKASAPAAPPEPARRPTARDELAPAPRASAAAATPPAPAAAPVAPVAPGAPRGVQPRSVGEAWQRFLAELRQSHGALADLLEKRGRLEDLGAESAVIHLDAVRGAGLRMVRDKRNQAACARALGRVVGREIAVTLDSGEEARPGAADGFTREVADLFGGVIEDRG